jgi:ubiquinone/menaquinone biosynthesis C-methylase UbiE
VFLDFARISSPYLTYARTRHALPNLQFEIGDAGHLPCANGAFAASLSQLVLTFVTDPEQVAAEMVRITRPGGVVAAAAWEYCRGLVYQPMLWDTAAALDPQRVAFAIDCLRIRSARLTV